MSWLSGLSWWRGCYAPVRRSLPIFPQQDAVGVMSKKLSAYESDRTLAGVFTCERYQG